MSGLLHGIYNALVVTTDKLSPLLATIPGKTGAFFRGRLEQEREALHLPDNALWFHVASTGEYEQALPVIEAWRRQYPDWPLAISFFSPSGYEMFKGRTPADVEFYLPLDHPRKIKALLEEWKPRAAVFVKYEFWPNWLDALARQHIPVFLISAVFRRGHPVLRWRFLRQSLENFRRIYVQDRASQERLNRAGYLNVSVAGDTRFDRVLEVSREEKTYPEVEDFRKGNRLLIAGSTWPADEDILVDHWIRHRPQGWKLMLVPHEPTDAHIRRLMQKAGDGAVRLSGYKPADREKNILVADVKGLLKYVYRYGDLAYVGGGFGRGIHNTLEAAVYGIPVIFGPHYHKFLEANELLERKAAYSITGKDDFGRIFQFLQDDRRREEAGKAAAAYVKEKAGATERIVRGLESFLTLEK